MLLRSSAACPSLPAHGKCNSTTARRSCSKTTVPSANPPPPPSEPPYAHRGRHSPLLADHAKMSTPGQEQYSWQKTKVRPIVMTTAKSACICSVCIISGAVVLLYIEHMPFESATCLLLGHQTAPSEPFQNMCIKRVPEMGFLSGASCLSSNQLCGQTADLATVLTITKKDGCCTG